MTNKHPVEDLHYIKLLRKNPEYISIKSYNRSRVLLITFFCSLILSFVFSWIVGGSNNPLFGILYIFFIFSSIVLFFVNGAYAIYCHIMAEKEIKKLLDKNKNK